MTMPLEIREESAADAPAIARVVAEAFGRDDEARLVELLRDGGWARLSLVAQLDGQVVGHLLFSELWIVGESGPTPALALAPLAVAPPRQSQGIGSALVWQGLERCRQRGHRIVVVLGHPHYYRRFGFASELARPLESPYAGDAFMVLPLVPGALDQVRGRVEYAPPFSQL